MTATLRRPILGVLVAIAVTTALDATGLSAFSALPLFPLMALFWYLEHLPRPSMGFGEAQSSSTPCRSSRRPERIRSSVEDSRAVWEVFR